MSSSMLQQEVDRLKQQNTELRNDIELYEAMKEGVTQRVTDLEDEIQKYRNNLELIMLLAKGEQHLLALERCKAIMTVCKNVLGLNHELSVEANKNE